MENLNPSVTRPAFTVLSFDYSAGDPWPDLPRLRVALERLVAAWSPHLRQELTDMVVASSPGDAMAALEDLLLNRLETHDAVVVYVGGHGARLGEDYFVAGPASTPEQLTSRNSAAASDIAQLIGQGRPRQVTLLVDTCHSGGGSARVTAAVDEILGREAKDGFSMFVMSSAHALESAWDGHFVEELLGVLADPEPLLWAKSDRYVAPSQVARALREYLGDAIESRERNYVEPIIPNLAFRDWATTAAEASRVIRGHFLRAASGTSQDALWCFVGRDSTLAAIHDWLSGPGGMFVLTGPPGSGKSAILGLVALSRDTEGREEIRGRGGDVTWEFPHLDVGHTTIAVHARERTLDAVMVDLAFGLGSAVAHTSDVVLAQLAARSAGVLLLVDALDEADPDDALRIAAFLREAADIPGVHVLVGTRPDRARNDSGLRFGPLLSALEPAEIHDLRDDPRSARKDIAHYVETRLSTSQPAAAGALAAAIADEVAVRADGVFLYARLMVEVLLTGEPLAGRPWKARLPAAPGGDLLRAVVDEDLRRIPANQRDTVRRMLMALSFAEGEGLPRRSVWPTVAQALTGEAHDDRHAGAAVRWASWYLAESSEAGQSVYRLNHEELIRYFRSEASREF